MSNKETHVLDAPDGKEGPRPAKPSRRKESSQRGRLAAVYESRRRYLLWRAEVLLRDSEEAREVVQETFLAFMLAQPSLRGDASHSTVLQVIFDRKVVNCLRRRSRELVRMGPLDLAQDEDTSYSWEVATAHDGGRGRVEALKELAELTRGETPQALKVACLYLLEGRTFGEIGRELDLGRKVVSQMLQQLVERALRRSTRRASTSDGRKRMAFETRR